LRESLIKNWQENVFSPDQQHFNNGKPARWRLVPVESGLRSAPRLPREVKAEGHGK
jgi:hypothetical protein